MRYLITLVAGLLLVPIGQGTLAAEQTARPNIVVILVDDMGFSDLGCYGSEIPTPNLDQLADQGLRFTQFYNTARCCPTRATLLTGLYSHQTGVGHMVEDKGSPGYRGRLNDQCVTLPEVLGPAGYFTAMTGKWHVGQNHGVTPWGRGFERSLTAAAGGFYFPNSPRTELFFNGKNVGRNDDPLPKDWYSTDLWTEFGLKFIDEAIVAKKPFLLYLAHNAPHFPLQAPDDEIVKFRGQYKVGWDQLRQRRHAKQIELGLVEKSWPLAPRPQEVAAWDSLSDQEKDRFDHIMAIYAACVSRMDRSIGTLVQGLKQRGQLDNTLILFMSDNGGNAEAGPKGRFNGEHPGDALSDVYCGESWATVQNTPFRRYKHFNHEGGIASPLIAHWPAGIAAKGQLRRQPSHLIDIMATCVDVGGARYPAEFQGQKILPMEGRSLVPAFGNQAIQRDALYWEHEGNAAIRVADWKLVRLGKQGAWELYDLKADRTEQHNLAPQLPDKVKDLAAKWNAWAERCHVMDKSAKAENAPKKKSAELPQPTSRTVREIEGWKVRVDDRLSEPPNQEISSRALRFLETKLIEIKIVVPAERVKELQSITIVLDLNCGNLGAMQYHPDAGWLRTHGFPEDLAKCVHLPRAADLPTRRNTNEQPWVILHELAHAYHDQKLGFDEPRIREAYERFKESGRGDAALLYNGQRVKHYGLTNHKEFFAEMTESFFGTNDFYPFNRAELQESEPELFSLLSKIWTPEK